MPRHFRCGVRQLSNCAHLEQASCQAADRHAVTKTCDFRRLSQIGREDAPQVWVVERPAIVDVCRRGLSDKLNNTNRGGKLGM